MSNRFLLIIVSVFILFACEDQESKNEFTADFSGKKAFIQSSDIDNIRLKNLSGDIKIDESVPAGQVRIEASEDVNNVVKVVAEGGELRFEGTSGNDSVDIVFYMNPEDLERIVVEGDNNVYISSTPVLDYLELISEGASVLTIEDLKVRNLNSRREGKSRMFLSSEVADYEQDSLYFPDSVVLIMDNRYIFYTEEEVEYVLVAPLIEVRNDSVFALATEEEELQSFFIIQSHELSNQGESYLDALNLPTLNIYSKNEGESEAYIWVLDYLEVKGEGESAMYYFGNPELNLNLNGAATVNPLE